MAGPSVGRPRTGRRARRSADYARRRSARCDRGRGFDSRRLHCRPRETLRQVITAIASMMTGFPKSQPDARKMRVARRYLPSWRSIVACTATHRCRRESYPDSVCGGKDGSAKAPTEGKAVTHGEDERITLHFETKLPTVTGGFPGRHCDQTYRSVGRTLWRLADRAHLPEDTPNRRRSHCRWAGDRASCGSRWT